MSEQNRNDELVANITDNIRKITNTNHLRTIQKEIKEQRSYIGRKIGNQLQIGDKVKVNNGTTIEYGEIIKVNRTRAVVKIDDMNWNVPFSMITKEVDNV